MRSKVAIVLVVGVVLLGGYTHIGVADDDWPDKCKNANSISPGKYEGSLSPKDRDVFVLPIQSGDYISVRMDFEAQNQDARIALFGLNQDAISKARKYGHETSEFQEYFEKYGNPDYAYRHYKDLSITGDLLEGPQPSNGVYQTQAAYEDDRDYVEEGIDYAVYDDNSLGHIIDEKLATTGTTDLRVYAESNSSICLVLQTANQETPGHWNFNFVKNQSLSTSTKTITTPNITTTTHTKTSPVTTETTTKDSATISTKSTIQDSDGDGVIDSEDYAPNDPEVQEKSDLQTTETSTPGFTILVGLVGLILASLHYI